MEEHMTSEYAYEVIAAIFLIVIMVSYKKKNWLDLYMNRCFDQLLKAGVLFNVVDIVINILREFVFPESIFIRNLDSVIPRIAMLWLSVYYFQY